MAEKISSDSPVTTQPPPPTKIVQLRPTSKGRNILWQGILLYFGAVLVVTLGIIGYLEYEELVEPNLNIFVCCVPSVIIAAILIFFGFATRMNVVRTVRRSPAMIQDRPPVPNMKPSDDSDRSMRMSQKMDNGRIGGLRKYRPPNVTKEELVHKKDNLTDFITNLDEQHKSGLLYDEAYLELKSKYEFELNDLNSKLRYFEVKTPKHKKLKK